MNVEFLGVDYFELAISRTDYLVASFNKNDKEPSWDGHIAVYGKPGGKHNKVDLIRNVPVQIKGHKSNDLTKDTIKYSVERSDLKNYLAAGGTAYIVVYVNEDGSKYSIYINRLLPFELKQMLKDKITGNLTIQLKRLSEDKTEISNIMIGFARDMMQQSAAINADPITLDDFVKQYPENQITISYTQVPDKNVLSNGPFSYLFDHDAYIYGCIGHSINLPLQHIEKIDVAGTITYKPVCVGDKCYYSQYQEVYTKLNKEFIIGKSINFKIAFLSGKPHFSYTLSGNLDDRIYDSNFIIDAFDNHAFSIGGVSIGLSENKDTINNIEKLKELSRYYQDIKKVLTLLNVKADLDLTSMKDADHVNMERLIDAFLNKKPIPVENSDSMIGTYTIGNLSLLIWAVKEEQSGLCYLFNFSDNPYKLSCIGNDGKEFDSDVSVTLDANSLLKYDNIDYKKIIERLKAVSMSDAFANQLNMFLLHILSSYDKRKDNTILSFAKNILEILRNSEFKDTPYFVLNELQIIYRKRSLKSREIKKLKEMLVTYKESYDIATGAYILIKNKAMAYEMLGKMDEEESRTFKEFPIYNLLDSSQ